MSSISISSTISVPLLRIGIAIFAQTDARRNRPRAPHWALVLYAPSPQAKIGGLDSGSGFSAPDVRVFHIRGRNGVWTLGQESSGCAIRTLGVLVGVLEVEVRAYATPELEFVDEAGPSATEPDVDHELNPQTGQPTLSNDIYRPASESISAYLSLFPPTRSTLPDPSGLFIWTCESYVIRALAGLEAEGTVRLPCRPEEIYEYTKRRINVLKEEKKRRDSNGSGPSGNVHEEVVVVPFEE